MFVYLIIIINLSFIMFKVSNALISRNVPKFAANSPMRRFLGSSAEDTVVARCTQKITDALKPTIIKVTASNDDPNGSHIQILCVSNEFQGKNSMQRQKLVYKAIWDEMSGPVHAVDAIIAKTPDEYTK